MSVTLKLLVVVVAAVSIICPHATGTPFADYLVTEYEAEEPENVTGLNATNGPVSCEYDYTRVEFVSQLVMSSACYTHDSLPTFVVMSRAFCMEFL